MASALCVTRNGVISSCHPDRSPRSGGPPASGCAPLALSDQRKLCVADAGRRSGRRDSSLQQLSLRKTQKIRRAFSSIFVSSRPESAERRAPGFRPRQLAPSFGGSRRADSLSLFSIFVSSLSEAKDLDGRSDDRRQSRKLLLSSRGRLPSAATQAKQGPNRESNKQSRRLRQLRNL